MLCVQSSPSKLDIARPASRERRHVYTLLFPCDIVTLNDVVQLADIEALPHPVRPASKSLLRSNSGFILIHDI